MHSNSEADGYSGESGMATPASPKKPTGLIIGAVIVAIFVVAAGVGAILLWTGDGHSGSHNDSDGGKSAPHSAPSSIATGSKITQACPLLSPTQISQVASGRTFQATEEPSGVTPNGKGTKYRCSYSSPGTGMFVLFLLNVYDRTICQPQACFDDLHQPNQRSVSGVGQAAAYYEGETNELTAVETIDGHTILITVIGPGPKATADQLTQLGKAIFAAAEKASE